VSENDLTVKECAQKTRKSEKTIRRWITQGFKGKKLFAPKAGNSRRINPNTFEKYLFEIAHL